MNIFIDTNIYLNFYNLSNEDLDELAKVLALQKNGEIIIYLPKQVENEFARNRESTIKNALQQFKEDSLKDKIPNMAKTYGEYEDLSNLKKEYSKAKNAILEKMETDIANESLKADELIKVIFQFAVKIDLSEEIYKKAYERHSLGNPPGKRDSLGDAINWESLLMEFSKDKGYGDKNLCIISSDGDYQSELNDSKPRQFLYKEWEETTERELSFFKRISLFTAQHFPKINITAESEKQLTVQNFIESGSFRNTHQVIEQLSKLSDFSAFQINKMLQACIENSQIANILDDEDVTEFIANLIENNTNKADYSLCYEIAPLLSTNTDNEILNSKVDRLQDYYNIPF